MRRGGEDEERIDIREERSDRGYRRGEDRSGWFGV